MVPPADLANGPGPMRGIPINSNAGGDIDGVPERRRGSVASPCPHLVHEGRSVQPEPEAEPAIRGDLVFGVSGQSRISRPPCLADSFCIDPTGAYLLVANQDTNDIATFAIDIKTGFLSPTGQLTNVPRPVCLRFMPELHCV